jgi:hypothetical protein
MNMPEQATVLTFRQQQVLDQLQGGVRTWDELRKLVKISDDGLGLTIGALLDKRKIWAEHKNDVRFYGLERRAGLAPRFSNPRRRSSDRIGTAKERRAQ